VNLYIRFTVDECSISHCLQQSNYVLTSASDFVCVMGQGKTFKHLSFFRAAGPVMAIFCSTIFVKLVHPSSMSVVYFLNHPSSLELTVMTGGINSPNQIVFFW
jgi:hypothetical protein